MSPPEGNVSPPVEHLLGDLGGVRTDLAHPIHGLEVVLLV